MRPHKSVNYHPSRVTSRALNLGQADGGGKPRDVAEK
jgi:hypothetical protein